MQKTLSAAIAVAAATSAFAFAAPANAASSAGACASQLSSASIPLGQTAYAVQFGAEQGPFPNHGFIYTELESARTKLQGPACAGFARVVKAEVDAAIAGIDTGVAELRAGDWKASWAALEPADEAVSSAYYKVWKIAHP
ncbi:hypothetical protein ACFWNN_28065 [Lentzea sp. NPDC058450]|uniref:hypothetical protein n=1 Tax=Lentzea sp. NPDC058450 TaxID=3346505 RepID=UPI00365700A1